MKDHRPSTGRSRLWVSVRALIQSQPHLTFGIACLSIIAGLFPAAFGLATGALVEAVSQVRLGPLASANERSILVALAVMSALLIVQTLLATVEDLMRPLLQTRFSRDIRSRVLAAVQRPLGIAHLEDSQMLDSLSLVVQENSKWEAGELVTGGALILARFTQGVASIILVAQFRWWAALLLAGLWIMVRASTLRVITSGLFEGLTAMRRANYMKDVATRPLEAKEVRLFGLHDWFLARYTNIWRTTFVNLWRLQGRERALSLLWLGAVTAAHGVVFILLTRAAANGEVTLGNVTVVLQAIFAMAALGEVSNADTFLENGLHVVPPVLALEQLLAKRAGTLQGSGIARGLPVSAIQLENVHFRYPGKTSDILHGLNLKIQAGKSLAIVGENGAGKTTLVKLLARLYDPDQGRIMVDDCDLTTLQPGAWRHQLAAVFQDFVHYELSIADNIGYGALERRNDIEALRRAASRAGVLPLIESLPHGWETILSRRYQDGTELSGGQWQRIALARAFFRVEAGASILVLDEPTSALDVKAEAEFFDHFLDLTSGLTTIIISHRFSTVRRADRIIVLENGRVIEEGSHAELMATGKRYAYMFTLQANQFSPATESGPRNQE